MKSGLLDEEGLCLCLCDLLCQSLGPFVGLPFRPSSSLSGVHDLPASSVRLQASTRVAINLVEKKMPTYCIVDK